MTKHNDGGTTASENHYETGIVLQGVQKARLQELAELEDEEIFLSLSVFVCVQAMSAAPEFFDEYAEFLHRSSIIHDLLTCERQAMNSKHIAKPKNEH